MGRIEFSPVTQKHDKIMIVANGPSAKAFRPIPGWTIIAVNNGISITKHFTDYWFTLDPSFANHRIMTQKPYSCYYYAAVPEDYGESSAKALSERLSPPNGIHYLRRLSIHNDAQKRFYGLCENKGCIATGNSAFGALNLALHMHPSQVIIIGLDANKEAKVDGQYSRSLDHLPKLFESSVELLNDKGIDVINASKYSKVTCFKRMHFNEVLCNGKAS